MKYYFRADDPEPAYSLQYFDDTLQRPFELFEAVPVTNTDFFFCKAVGEWGEKGNCGRDCSDYKPRNGKSGICRHYGRVYEPGELVKFGQRKSFKNIKHYK